MSSLKQLIVNAIIKVSEANPALDREGEPSAEEARDAFIKALCAELFPEDPAVPAATPKKTKKTKKTKTEDAPVVVEKVDDVPPPLEKVPETEVAVAETPKKVKKTKAKKAEEAPVVAEAPAAEPVAESPGKKKRAPMSEEAKAAMKAKREATLAAKKAAAEGQAVNPAPEESVVETSGSNAAAGAGPAPAAAAPEPVKEKKAKKVKPAEDANLAKIDPTWRKHLKHADKDHAKELEPELLKYLNALSKDDFNAKKAEEHIAEFLASRKPAVEDDGKVETDLVVVDFNGKEYFVNPETKRVYEGEGTCDAEGNWTSYKGVGYVGMAAFAEMKLEED